MRLSDMIRKFNAERCKYIKTDIREFDDTWAGLSVGELTVFADRPAMGTFKLLCNFARNISKRKETVLFITNCKRDVMEQIIALEMEISSYKVSKLRFISDYNRYPNIKLPIYIEELFFFNKKRFEDIIKNVRPKVIFIDLFALGFINPKKIKYLQDLAKNNQISIVLSAYLNRQVDERKIKYPRITDLYHRKQRGIIENIDTIFLLYRENYYKLTNETPEDIMNKFTIYEAKTFKCGYFRMIDSGEVIGYFD